ncbi:hypothetical protein HOA55_03710 [archaeon]|jgi:hypothetical protein|nr:hypothetical protein [archaeon]MBT3577321.1 hypothetical protein [archaeon]MBT6820435.1 hypothetical protein [archaeon]MBT6956260.1 hypothetical protein [archaeon]MBT7025249.1 hypothetical protein [archaeon]
MKKELLDFIKKAKQATYASESSVEKKGEDGGKNYKVEEGDWTYTDTYFGNLVDCGQERIYENGKVIWMMAYRGGTLEKYDNMSKEAFGFLKKCISKAPEEFPARGPKKVEEGDWVYENNWEGDIEGFVGEENIYFKGKKICFRNYFGGLVRNRK